MNLFLAVVLLALAIGGVVVRKTYYYLPARELKRQAEHGDKLAKQLYRAVAYGSSLRSLLWLYIGLVTAASLIILARELPIWASLLIVGPVLWAAFSWLPSSRRTKIGAALATAVTPAVVFLLNYLHPVLSRGTDSLQKRLSAKNHTGLFEREDLIELIEQQQWQNDSRITPEELEIVKRALTFEDYKVADILVSRKKVKTVLATDTVGPILIDELHKSGQDYVLVRDKKGGMVVGTLEFKRLNLQSQGKVGDLMTPNVYYIHEDDNLSQALHAFFATNHSLFVVVNSFEEYVGIVSVENILKQLLGHIPGEDFDQYTNVEAVAARHPGRKKASAKEAEPDETPVETDAEVLE
jgi:CBS domain containing-hemolysin-like protein